MAQISGTWHEIKRAVVAHLLALPDMSLVLVGGPSGAGKSTFVEELQRARPMTVIPADAFRLSKVDREKLGRVFGLRDSDHPDAYDLQALAQVLCSLSAGQSVSLDWPAPWQQTMPDPLRAGPRDLICAEGLHVLARSFFGRLHLGRPIAKIFLEAPREIRFMRRLLRDIRHRGTAPMKVLRTWANVVDRENEYVLPGRRNASFVVSTLDDPCEVAELDRATASLRQELRVQVCTVPLLDEQKRILRGLLDDVTQHVDGWLSLGPR